MVVVGAGFAGLTAALHLLGAGRRVTIVERGEHPGGRAGQLDLETERGTYRIDTGPTVLTMPDLLDEAFAAVGEKLTERLDLSPSIPATAPTSPTAPPSTCTPTARRWSTRCAECAGRRPPRATSACGSG